MTTVEVEDPARDGTGEDTFVARALKSGLGEELVPEAEPPYVLVRLGALGEVEKDRAVAGEYESQEPIGERVRDAP